MPRAMRQVKGDASGPRWGVSGKQQSCTGLVRGERKLKAEEVEISVVSYRPPQHLFLRQCIKPQRCPMYVNVDCGGDHQRLTKVVSGTESQQCVDVAQVNQL